MNALLAKFQEAGITLTLDGDTVRLRGPAEAIARYKPEIAAAKPEIVAALKAQPPRCKRYPASHARFWRAPTGEVVCDTCHPALPGTPREVAQEVLDRHPGRAGLLDDLRKGSEWLDRAANRPEGIPDAFHVVLSDWTAKEKALRALFGFTGCVLTPARCKPESAVSCLACVPERPAS